MDSLSPNLFVASISKSIAFYKKLGFEVIMTVPEHVPEQDLVWVMISLGKVTFMLQTMSSLGEELPEIKRERGAAMLLYIRLSSIRVFFEKLKNDLPILKGLDKTFYGATEFSVLDPDGFVLTFAEDE